MPKATLEDVQDLSVRDLRDKERKIIELARTDIRVFTHFVFGIKNMPLHDYIQALFDKHQFITIDCPVDHGKTVQTSIIRILWTIGHDPYATIANLSSTPRLPKRSLGVIRANIEENERLAMVFPKLRLVENTKETITVERKAGVVKDPTVSAMGIEGNILGSRWSMLVSDDMVRFDSQWTEWGRDKLFRRFTSECQGRMEADSQHIDIGTPWQVSDARHKIRKLDGYLFLRFDGWSGEVFDIRNRKVHAFEGGLWPVFTTDRISGKRHGWPRERLERAKKKMPGHEFQRQIRCVALSEAMAIFSNHLDRCCEIGEGIEMHREDEGPMRVCWRPAAPTQRYIFTGVDLAIDKKSTSADTAFFTGATENGTKHPLEFRRGKIEGPDILRNMISIVRRYPLHTGWRVESNQGQAYLQQFADEEGLLETLGASKEEAQKIRGCITPHFTGGNKNDSVLGIRAMSADFERGRWVIPQMEGQPEDMVQEWLEALRAFDPTGHPDDMLVGSWLFWEACRGFSGNSSWDRFGIWVPR